MPIAYQSSAGDLRKARQHRAATAPTPSKASFSAIPPSLIPGHRHTLSATSTNTLTNGLLCFGPSTGTRTNTATAYTLGGDTQGYFSINPSPSSPYGDFQPPLPPLPMPQSLQPQSVVPPIPPKPPVIMSPKTSPTLPPKPPPFMPPPNFFPPAVLPRSISQPPPLMPRGASSPPPVPPPPPPLPTLPPKPPGARSPSLAAKRSPDPQPLAQPNVSPSAKHSSIVQEPNDTALPAPLPPPKSPAEGSDELSEEQQFELALELSAQAERERVDALLRAQEEDINRALERSLIDSAPRRGSSGSRAGPSTLNYENVPSSSSTIPRDAHHPRSQKPVSRNVTLSPVDIQLQKDEELARQLEAEDDTQSPTQYPETNQRVDPNPSNGPPLPPYGDSDIVGRETAAVNRSESDAASLHVPQAQLNSARSRERLFIPDQANTPQNTPFPPFPAQRTSPRPESQTTTASQEEAEAPEHTPTPSQPPRPVVTPYQFVEPELLYGASFGDHTPPVQNLRYQGGLPDVLALPYGKGQPIHIRASSWRQLLKLLAKLSATRIEPTVEARAQTKGALLLRTVIQFFKPLASSTDWRVVIYLTIDYPPPLDHRYTNGVVNSLPYSYSLSTLPPLLRDGPDSSLSKYYTIPATSRTPLPKLPISLQDMTTYLVAALEDSRAARSDSSGHRRLAKMINQFCPDQRAREAAREEEGDPRGLGRAIIGRLMGRPSRPPQGGGHNADMFDVVSPFISEWG